MDSLLSRISVAGAFALAAFSTARAGIYSNNFDGAAYDPTSNPPGAALYQDARIETTGGLTGGALKITKSINGQAGSFVIEDFDAGAGIGSWVATFKARIGGGTNPPADGWCFCWAPDLPAGVIFHPGTGSGLVVQFDTYVNGDVGETSPTVAVKWNGVTLARTNISIPAITTDDAPNQYADVTIRMNNDASVDVTFDGTAYYTKIFTPNTVPMSGGKFGFGGNTGGLNSNHWIDNLTITTTAGPVRAGFAFQPQSSTLVSGTNAKFYALMGNDALALGYQWERQEPGGGAFLPVATATFRDFVSPVPVTAADNGAKYRLAVTDATGVVYSNEVTLTVTTFAEPAYPFFTSFDGGVLPAGTAVYGNAIADPTGFLGLTDAFGNQTGGLVVENQNPGSGVAAIFVSFDLLMGQGGAPPADGFSFNWGLNMPSGTVGEAENGAGDNLRLCYDVYDNTDGNPLNGFGEGPTLDLRWGTTVLSSVRVSPFEFNTGTNFIHTAVKLDTTGKVSVRFNDRLYFQDVQVPGWVSLIGARYGFYARTGGAFQQHRIDNLGIATTLYSAPVVITDEVDDAAVAVGGTATFTVGASYPIPPATVVWERKPVAGVFAPIPGASGASYTTPVLTAADNGVLYRAIVSESVSATSVTSREALLTVIDFSQPGAPQVVLNFNGDLANTGSASGVVPAATTAGNSPPGLRASGGPDGSGYLSLTDNINGLNGSVLVANYSGATAQGSLLATFDMNLTGGTNPPADGFSFVWGPNAPTGSIGPDAGGDGLGVTFDTYDNVDGNPNNGTGEAPSIGIRWNGTIISEVLVPLSLFQSPPGWVKAGIRVQNDGTVDVMYDLKVILTNIQIPGWTGLPNGRFNLGGATGGLNENHWVDNLVISSVNYAGPINFTQQPVNTNALIGLPKSFVAQVNDPGQTSWQWQTAPSGSGTFTNVGTNSNTYTIPIVTVADNGRQFRVIATGLSNTITSNIAVLTAIDSTLPPPQGQITFDAPSTLAYNFVGTGTESLSDGVGNTGCGKLTINQNDQQGSLFVNDYNGGAAVSSMIASWDMSLGGGTGTPADGFCFVWASDINSGSNFGEEGGGSGFQVSFDTYANGGGDVPGITVKWQGAPLGEVQIPFTDLLNFPGYFPIVVKLDSDGTVDVWYNNRVIFHDLAIPGFTPISGGHFLWGARTGGLNENAWVDNINLYTAVAVSPVIDIQRIGSNIQITYPGTLQSTTNLIGGPWQNVPGATSPYTIPVPASGKLFFRATIP